MRIKMIALRPNEHEPNRDVSLTWCAAGHIYEGEDANCPLCKLHDLELQATSRDEQNRDLLLKLDEETKIVARIWEVLGSPSYDELKGRSIYEVIQGWIDRAISYERRLGELEKAVRVFVFAANRDGWPVLHQDCFRDLSTAVEKQKE